MGNRSRTEKEDKMENRKKGSDEKISEKIKVSVVIPVYNAEKYLHKCIDSVWNQTLQGIEIVAVNDGSTDDSLSVLKKYQERLRSKEDREAALPVVSMKIYSKDNGGQSSARNMALEVLQGEYVAFLDSDDYLETDYLERLYVAAKRNQSDVVCSGQKRVDEEGNLIALIRYPVREDGSCILRRLNFSGKLYRRAYMESHHMRFAEGKTYEDNPFNLVMFFLARNFVVLPYEGYYQVVHQGSTTTKKIIKEKLPLLEIEAAVQYLAANESKINDKQLLEFTLLSFFTYFIFQANKKHHYLSLEDRESDIEVVMELCDYVKRILETYFPEYYHNIHLGLCKERDLSLSQRAGTWLLVRLIRSNLLKTFTRLYYKFSK